MTRRLFPALLCILLLCSCGSGGDSGIFYCRVVLEEGAGYTCADHVRTVPPGRDAVFSLRCADGYTIVGADCGDYNLESNANGGITFTVHDVKYSTVISLTAERSAKTICYDSNDGSGVLPIEVPVTPSHLRWNTATGLFARSGYTLTGWNACPDGSGRRVGLGSRIEPEERMTLYAQWAEWDPAEQYHWRVEQGGAAITAYLGTEETAVVPGELGGLPVRTIQAGAFENAPCRAVVLPDTLYAVEDGAFRGCALQELCLFDNIRSIGDPAFEGCEHLAALRLNAVEPPVYSGTYYDTFQDKFDRLSSLRDRKKIVLFSGSSTRFGFDCAALDEAFPEYEIVNMGVFAYTNAMPQMELILSCMEDGDILLHCPEFDASREQFCTTNDLDEPFFSMMESNYGTLELLDLRRYRAVFTPLGNYLAAKDPMSKRSYALSPADFDEDGNPVDSPSYNQYGDYIVYRPNAATSLPVFGAPIHYTAEVFPKEVFLNPLNTVYGRFQEKGVSVYFSYAPRNALALSESSTLEARLDLDRYLRENLCAPVITELENSLWDGIYLYGTDNHLSTEGAAIRTQRLISALQVQMEKDMIVNKHSLYG